MIEADCHPGRGIVRKLLMCRIPFLAGLVTLASAVMLIGAAHAQVYKWVDDKGVVNYSSSPPPKGKGVVKLDEDNGRVTTIPAPEMRHGDPAAAADPALAPTGRSARAGSRRPAADRRAAGGRRRRDPSSLGRAVPCRPPRRLRRPEPRRLRRSGLWLCLPARIRATATASVTRRAGHVSAHAVCRAGRWGRRRAVLPAPAGRDRGRPRPLRDRRRIQSRRAGRRGARARSSRNRRPVCAGARVGGAATAADPAPASDAAPAVADTFPCENGAVRRRFASYGPAQRGSSDVPIRNSSTARAHCRPSRIAHTTSDCPRRMSPAANTFGTEVA